MTTTGTATFDLDLTEICEEAFERCGAELRTGYDLRTARRSLNLLFMEWANRGINLWTLEEGTLSLTDGTATYNLPVDTVDIIDQKIRTGSGSSQLDTSLTRLSTPAYAAIANKLTESKPLQVWVNRQGGQTDPTDGVLNPTVTFWPVPNASYTCIYWRLRRIQDMTTGPNTADVPYRFIPALIAGLAYQLSLKIPGAGERMEALKMMYDEQFQLAADEDREKADWRIVPRISGV